MDSSPFVLQPMNLRSGIRYRDLGNHFFSSEDIEWICRDLVSTNDVQTATSTWNQAPFDTYFTRYGIPIAVLHDWVDTFIRGKPLVAGKPSISCPIDEIGVEIITQVINEGQHTNESSEEFDARLTNTIEQETRNTTERRAFIAC